MYIEPRSNIRILHNIPLDTSYEHTIYFADAVAQRGYFMYNQKFNLENYSYQRVQRGRARVGIKADDLYDCNYMMFQNSAYGDKWFYEFITSVEFINNETSEIAFEIDVMQTWHFDYEPEYCFVEREHSTTDIIGDNIIPETLELGEYVFNGEYESITPELSALSVIIAVVEISDQQAVDGKIYDRVYGASTLYAYDSTDIAGINQLLQGFLRNPENITGLYMIPTRFIENVSVTDHKILTGQTTPAYPVSVDPISYLDEIDGYLPNNAKLYTYPYNFYHVDNASSNELTIRYEFCRARTPQFEVTGTLTQPVVACLKPVNYKGIPYSDTSGGLAGLDPLNTEKLILSNYPMCSWNMDAYQAWIAQNSIPLTISSLTGLAYGVNSSANSWGYRTPVNTIIGQVGSIISEGYRASIASDISRGSQTNGTLNVPSNKQQFYGGRCSITAQYAKMIDDYFTMFGYAVHTIKKPNRNYRRHWNYVKTIGANIIGSVPADDMKKIINIYDHGITFWKNGSEVGNYSLNNSIIRAD